MPRSLPERPDLAQLRRQAKELQRAAAAGDPRALRRVDAVSPPERRTTLATAQLALAREHGFASWPRLKLEVERILQQGATVAPAAAKPAGRTTVGLRITGHRLPGLRWASYDSIHVGVQRQRAAVPPALVQGDADEATFDLTVDLVGDDQGTDFRGPFVHGRRGDRFVYLTWGELHPDGTFEMFRRAKLHLSALPDQDVARAAATGATIEATLDLTDADGGPVCAAVRPPRVSWRLTSPT
jgi:hypothetical protein